jgi:tetratricopeptide (TPR) repeat protein
MAQAYFLSGSAKFLTGDRAGARGDAQEALARQPNFVEAVELLARCHAALGDHALAVEAGKRALEQGAGPGMHIAIAQSLVQLGQRKDALEELAKIPEDRRGADGEYAIGRVHLIDALQLISQSRNERGEVVKPELDARANAALTTARTHLTRAAELAPNSPEVLASLVTVDLRQGQAEQSLARVRAATKAAPKDAALARLQGDVELAVGQLDAAQRSYERAIEIDPNQLESYGKLAGLYNRQGRASQVIQTYEAALQKNPKSGELHLVLGILEEAQGGRGIDDAIDHYRKAIELNPDLAAAKNNLAFWLAERGQELDYALDLAQEAKAVLAKNPRTNPSSADTLGWVFYKKNLPEAAVNYLREAVGGFDPSIPQDRQTRPLVRHHLALALAALGDESEAASEWKLALAEYGELPKAQGHVEPDWVKEARAALAKSGA